MRKFILIAGFVLASAAAQAGDRSLSLAGSETQAAPAPARATDASKSAEAAEAPKYVERPAVVEPKPESKAETSRPETSRAETARPRTGRAARMQRYATRPASAGPGSPSARRAAMMSRSAGAHRMRYGIRARIIVRTAPALASTGKRTSRARCPAKRTLRIDVCRAYEREATRPSTAKPGHDDCG